MMCARLRSGFGCQCNVYAGHGLQGQGLLARWPDDEPPSTTLHITCSWLQVFTLGASVTRGIGTTDRKHSYVNRLFEYIAHAFPHK